MYKYIARMQANGQEPFLFSLQADSYEEAAERFISLAKTYGWIYCGLNQPEVKV